MSFPIDYQKEFCWPATRRNEKVLVNTFVTVAVAELQGARASNIEAQDNRIQFTVRWFRWVGNWNLLTNIDKGVIEIAPAAGTFCVGYYLSFKRLLVQHCIGALGVFSFVILPTRGFPITFEFLAPVLMLLVFALNYLVAIRRFSRFIKRIIARANFESTGI